jgi:putative ATPase
MLSGGEDPRFIARRLLRFAYEDIGLADPNAAVQALTAWETYERLGTPEGELALVQAVIYLGTAPKSNAAYKAYGSAMRAAKETGSLMPPKHILNAPTKLMSELGYGDGYAYDHDAEDGFSGQDYFPEGMDRQILYSPVDRGFEREGLIRRSAFEDIGEPTIPRLANMLRQFPLRKEIVDAARTSVPIVIVVDHYQPALHHAVK